MAHLVESGADHSGSTESATLKPDLRRYFDGNGDPVDGYEAYFEGTAPLGQFSGFETAPAIPSGFRLMGRQHNTDGASRADLLGCWNEDPDGQLAWVPVEPKVQTDSSQNVAGSDSATAPHVDSETGKPVILVRVAPVRESGSLALPSVPKLSDDVRQRIGAVLTSPSS